MANDITKLPHTTKSVGITSLLIGRVAVEHAWVGHKNLQPVILQVVKFLFFLRGSLAKMFRKPRRPEYFRD